MKTPKNVNFFAPAAGKKLSELLHHNRIIQSIIHPPENGGTEPEGGTARLISPDKNVHQLILFLGGTRELIAALFSFL